MIQPRWFQPHSFIIGLSFDPTFTFEDRKGTIADYVLGEAGAENSPVPKEFFDGVGITKETVAVGSPNKPHTITAQQNKIVYSYAKKEPSVAPIDTADLIPLASHLIQGVYELLRKPPIQFLGIVWEYAHIPTDKTLRFDHPLARVTAKDYIKVPLLPQEYPITASFRLNFRRRLPEAVSHPGINDFLSAIITLRDAPFKDVYEKAIEPPTEEGERPEIGIFSIDIQRFFDPRKRFESKMLNEHMDLATRTFTDRLRSILNPEK